ncbi:hypothetical protein ABK040_008541 [Willaertia magna]
MQTDQLVYEDAKAYLMESNENGRSLYDTLYQLVLYLQSDKRKGNVVNIEEILETLNEEMFRHNEKDEIKTNELWKKAKINQLTVNKANEICRLLTQQTIKNEEFERERAKASLEKKEVKSDLNTSNEEETENINERYLYSKEEAISNLTEELYGLETVGVGLPKEEIAKIQIGLQRLKEKKQLKYVRFVGKIFGIYSNYIICESNYHFEKKEPQDEIHESGGKQGINRFTYWVLCTNNGFIMSENCSYKPGCLENWIKLPDVTNEQINAARKIHKLFTGNLDHSMNTYPPFPGNESNYLRAQIARIVSATTLAPAELFTMKEVPQEEEQDEEDEEDNKKPKEIKYKELLPPLVEVKEDFEPKQPEAMKSLESWCHLYPHILKAGYNTKFPSKEENHEEEEEDKDPEIALLTGINEDTPLKKTKVPKKENKQEEEDEDHNDDSSESGEKDPVTLPYKIIQSCNRKQTINHKSYLTIGLASTRWPGAYTSYRLLGNNQCEFCNVYIGNGIKYSGVSFTPEFPPTVVVDGKEPVDQVDAKPNDMKRMIQGLNPTEPEATNDDEEDNDEDNEEDDDDN